MTFLDERLLSSPAASAVDPNSYMHASGVICNADGACVGGSVAVPSSHAAAFRSGVAWGALGVLGFFAFVAIAQPQQ